MDDSVLQALAKWPNVPHCCGWLALDARGDWYLRDHAAQAAGSFTSGVPGAKGCRLQHDKLLAFIHRNYGADEGGCWYFQNGPQRVYVELESTPLIFRLHEDGTTTDQCGRVCHAHSVWLDGEGHLYLHTDQGPGRVHTQDMHLAADRIEAGHWLPQPVAAAALEQHFGFVRSPQVMGRCQGPR